jgi:hypothetical protein
MILSLEGKFGKVLYIYQSMPDLNPDPEIIIFEPHHSTYQCTNLYMGPDAYLNEGSKEKSKRQASCL